MQERIKQVRRLFTITIVGLCVASLASLLGVLYVTETISFSHETSPQELAKITADYPAVAAYLQDQKKSEAHFITLANLVKSDQQQLLGRSAILAGLPVLLAAAILGYLLARFLLRPVSEAYASQERFLQDAAHELRNPLATMSAVIQQTRQAGADNAIDGKLAILERQTNQLVRINEDLLFLERKTTASVGTINVAELLGDVIESLQPMAHQYRVQLEMKGGDIQLAISSDDFVCLARNLIENAIKYRDAGKSAYVKVTVEQALRQMVLTVEDNGIGIPESELAKIGERFFRAGNVGRTAGTGLGFAIAQKVAADNKAEIQIQSVLGKGTTVRVVFKAFTQSIRRLNAS